MTDPDATTRLVLSFRSRNAEVRAALASINRFLAANGTATADRATAEIVVAELLNNIVEHAYGEDDAGQILLEAGFCAGTLCVQVTDHGGAMPGETLPQGAPPDISGPVDTLPEGGFGWFLLRSLTQNLRYTREGCANITRFAIATGGS